jgi:hypothetical protein
MKVRQGANDRLAAASGEFGEQRLQDFLVRVAGLDPPCLALHIVGDVNDRASPVRRV